jgi:uncharacterized membrane protein (UPF0182 family)
MTPQEIKNLITWRLLFDAIIATIAIIMGIWFVYGIIHDVFSLIPFLMLMLGLLILMITGGDDGK